VTQGNTYEEALFNIKEAAELYVDSLKAEELKSFPQRSVSITPIEMAVHPWIPYTDCKRNTKVITAKWFYNEETKRQSSNSY
jgi:hypothetical protein